MVQQARRMLSILISKVFVSCFHLGSVSVKIEAVIRPDAKSVGQNDMNTPQSQKEKQEREQEKGKNCFKKLNWFHWVLLLS